MRKLPLEKRIDYLLRAVRPDDSLATLAAAGAAPGPQSASAGAVSSTGSEIPQEGGMIDPDYDVEPPARERLAGGGGATARTSSRTTDVELYLASLLAMEPETWGGLAELLEEDRTG